ncbi:MAG: hypothetical protein MK212_10325 [Saprospiraceae bacterium]|nr:hypothetical protein [Saprospiraceae bacterium]
MNKLLLLGFFISLIYPNLYAQYSTTIQAEGAERVRLNFDYNELKDQKWGKESIEVELIVKSQVPQAVLDVLAQKGRYEVAARKVNGDLLLDVPNLKKTVIIKGKALEENITVRLSHPKFIYVEELETISFSKGLSGRSSDADDSAKLNTFQQPIQYTITLASSLKNPKPSGFQLKTGDIEIDGKIIELP